MKNKSKYIKILLLVVVAVLFVLRGVHIYNVTNDKVADMYDSGFAARQETAGLEKGMEITQDIYIDGEFNGIALYFSTNAIRNFSKITVELVDKTTGEVVFHQKVSGVNINDNQFSNFAEENVISGGKTYTLKVSTDTSANGKKFTLWTDNQNITDTSVQYSINGEKQNGVLCYAVLRNYHHTDNYGVFAVRMVFMTLILMLVCGLIIVGPKKMCEFIFDKRFYIAVGIFLILVIMRVNFSSIGMFDNYVQPGQGSEFVTPVYGETHSIRSDEWAVSTPRYLTAKYTDYGKYNYIIMGKQTENIAQTGLYKSYSALAKPQTWGCYLFGDSIGMSVEWCFPFILLIVMSIQFFYIIAGKNKVLAVTGGVMVAFSGYEMWWMNVEYLSCGLTALVCIYYFINAEKTWQRMVLSPCIAILGAEYITILYPAFQVPSGYVYFGIVVWMVVSSWDNFKKIKLKEWLVFAASMLFMASIVIVYLKDRSTYVTEIMNTIYPGSRVSTGGYSLYKMFEYVATIFYPFKATLNNSEFSMMVTLFPLPMVMAVYCIIKQKGKDILLDIMLGLSCVYTIYCTVGFPLIVARLTLFSYVPEERAADLLGLLQVILLIRCIYVCRENRYKVNPVIVVVPMLISCYYSWKEARTVYDISESGGMLQYAIIALAIVFTVITIVVFCVKEHDRLKNMALLSLAGIVFLSGIWSLTVNVGTDAIYSKPLAKKVCEITSEDKDGKWVMLDSWVESMYLAACGAPTINTCNNVPNWDLWNILDPQKENEYCYNRFAHMLLTLTEEDTNEELVQQDLLQLNLNYKDAEKIGVKYIASRTYNDDFDKVLEKYYNYSILYDEFGWRIYQLNSLKAAAN